MVSIYTIFQLFALFLSNEKSKLKFANQLATISSEGNDTLALFVRRILLTRGSRSVDSNSQPGPRGDHDGYADAQLGGTYT